MDEHKSIGDALVAFQAEVPTLAKDATNPHFRSKFTPLDTIVETIRPILAKHGLAWSALPCLQDGQPALRYELRHAPTGQVIGDTMPLLVVKADPQGMGSAITYARRYSLSAVLNLVADEDDDGNSASRPAASQRTRAPQASNGNAAKATPDDVKALLAAAKGLTVKQVKLGFSACGLTPPEPFEGDVFADVPQAKAGALAQALAKAERAT